MYGTITVYIWVVMDYKVYRYFEQHVFPPYWDYHTYWGERGKLELLYSIPALCGCKASLKITNG